MQHANDRRVWDQLRDAFPHPYTAQDAAAFLGRVSNGPATHLAIEVSGAAVGGIGCHRGVDVERISGEVGYWLGAEFWSRGILSEVLPAATRFFFEELGLTRLFALPFAGNDASCRVLAKSGYVIEGRLQNSAVKNGVVTDQILYTTYSS